MKREDITELESQFWDMFTEIYRQNNNIMVDEIRNKIVVRDFDGAGVHSTNMYPLLINPEINWPDGASSEQVLDYAHDAEWN